MKRFDVVILGGGASGLMCAAWLSEYSDLDVVLIEGNETVGKKLQISGGGKCNITNVDVQSKHYLGDAAFIDAVLENFGQKELLEYLQRRALKPVLRKERYYFCPESSQQIITLLLKAASRVIKKTGEHILHVIKDDAGYEVTTTRMQYKCRHLVVATGGESYKSIGASAIGLDIARNFGHEIAPFTPALAGLTLQKAQFWMKELSGISMPVRIYAEDRVIEEELLFAHKGISGPAVLSASLYWHKGTITIDFLPNSSIKALCHHSNKLISTALPLSKRFIKAYLHSEGINDKPCTQLKPNEIAVLKKLHHYILAPAGNFGFSKAEVCRGGVKTSQINPAGMESLLHTGLHFIGEVVDVTGELGGYNFQWAFTSGVKCAKSLVKLYNYG